MFVEWMSCLFLWQFSESLRSVSLDSCVTEFSPTDVICLRNVLVINFETVNFVTIFS